MTFSTPHCIGASSEKEKVLTRQTDSEPREGERDGLVDSMPFQPLPHEGKRQRNSELGVDRRWGVGLGLEVCGSGRERQQDYDNPVICICSES